MKVLQGRIRDYSWGSRNAIPELFGLEGGHDPIAELWLGAHPLAPSLIAHDPRTPVLNLGELDDAGGRDGGAVTGAGSGTGAGPDSNAGAAQTLSEYIATDPTRVLGADVVARHGSELPFLLKLIAPAQPLSLQVHPSKEQAKEGFDREEAEGIPADAKHRCYPDANHKPELVYALTKFEALVGFRSPRRIMGVLADLDTKLACDLRACIRQQPNATGVRRAFAALLSEESRPSEAEVMEVVAACKARPADESPSQRADLIVERVAEHHPGDPGVVASLLLNPVTLNPGEALFTPAGTVHAYLSGIGVEIMAASDNVLRAGLTPKHVDVPELLRVINTVAAPPIRIAPERTTSVQSTFYVPVDDFELSVIELRDANRTEIVRGVGPRVLLCLQGAVDAMAGDQRVLLNTGQAVFLDADDGEVRVRGAGRLVQADVP